MPVVLIRLVLLALCMGLAPVVFAGDISFQVNDQKGNPLEHAVIALTPIKGEVPPFPLPEPEMKQSGALFNPFVLPVRTGTTVNFPNFDEFRHHVYSFSKAKRFEIRLYGQDETKNVTFDKPGIIALGCNIHDNMLAYIIVLDAPIIARSDAKGLVNLAGVPEGRYTLELWHPDGKRSQPTVPEGLDVGAGPESHTLSVSLKSVRRTQLPPSEGDYN